MNRARPTRAQMKSIPNCSSAHPTEADVIENLGSGSVTSPLTTYSAALGMGCSSASKSMDTDILEAISSPLLNSWAWAN
jgi:hypothetical protein